MESLWKEYWTCRKGCSQMFFVMAFLKNLCKIHKKTPAIQVAPKPATSRKL